MKDRTMNLITKLLVILLLPVIYACSTGNDNADAYGNFEAREIIISSQSNGKLIDFKIEEGTRIQAGNQVGLVDTTQLYLKKKQVYARINALTTKTLDIPTQINTLIERRNNLYREKIRIEKLLNDEAATRKQLDDINGEIDVINSELNATREKLNTNNRGILSEINPLQYQIEEINDQINKSVILNPLTGTVLSKFAEEKEIVSFGKPLYRMANIGDMFLRAYISGTQLDNIRLGQKVTVRIDENEDAYKTYDGTISWISEKAEFTPKIVQTKEERVNLVYAIKVKVENDGFIKIGMPGEVIFQ